MKERGFTLIEVLIATVIIALAIVALLAANSAFTMANGAGIELSTAEFLVEQIREMTATIEVRDPDGGVIFGPEEGTLADYDDLDDFDGSTFSPPIDARRQPLTDFAAYSQQVTVQKVDKSNFEQVLPITEPSDFVRVTVSVSYSGRELCSISWIRARF
jgi:prepilin-type N-terminal cleavage/methylation domain-containing protein